ncbi:LysR family transcriptional regulator [Pseudoalteromonas phenolica]|uniref:LysR family transcriptional regulator n=1 Tax=Pseudoalteromonas phenolica TaxID=161398 RepID=UPI00384B8524
MENWDDYRLLLAVQQSNSIRAAGERLGVNHSTVSRRMQSINQNHPFKVFETTASGIEITEYGAVLLQTAHKMQDLMAEQARTLASQDFSQSGAVSLSLPPAILQFLLLDELALFQQQHPDIRLTVFTSYDFANLDSGEADVVIRVSNDPGDELVGHRVFPIQVGYFASREYLANTPPEQRVWITGANSDWVKNTPFAELPVRYLVEDLVTRHTMAAKGLGMIRGACYIAEHYPELVPVIDEFTPFQDLWVLTHPELRDTHRIKTVMQFLLGVLRKKNG